MGTGKVECKDGDVVDVTIDGVLRRAIWRRPSIFGLVIVQPERDDMAGVYGKERAVSAFAIVRVVLSARKTQVSS